MAEKRDGRGRDPRDLESPSPTRRPGLGRWLIAAVVALALARLSKRSGATDADIARVLPGDELLPDAAWVVDRAATLDAPPELVWPWLAQLGRRRGGWYMPSWLENRLPASWRGAREILPAFTSIAVGDIIPDYGPEPAYFQAVRVEPYRALVHVSFRGAGLTLADWPPVGGWRDDVTGLVWALVLSPVDEGTRTHLHVRLRVNRPKPGTWWAWPVRIGGGLVDWLTIVLLFAGLNERVRATAAAHARS